MSSPFVGSAVKVSSFASVLSSIPIETNISGMKSSERIEEAIERIKDLAYQEGFREGQDAGYSLGVSQGKRDGYRDGMTIGEEETKLALDAEMRLLAGEIQQIRDQLQVAIDDWFRASEEKMTDLAMGIVRQVLNTELSISRESALSITKEALKHVTHASHARIRINPSDSIYFIERQELLLQMSSCLRDCEIVSDPSVQAGCLIETDGGLIDARVETRLELIENELFADGSGQQAA